MSARRAARAGRLAGRGETLTLAGLEVPAELADPGHELWQDREAYRGYMRSRGWTLPAADRLPGTGSASPSNRRRAAAAGWAQQVGIRTGSGHADWHRLAALVGSRPAE